MRLSVPIALLTGCAIEVSGLAAIDARVMDAETEHDARAVDAGSLDGRSGADAGSDLDAGPPRSDAGERIDAGRDAGLSCSLGYLPNAFGTCYREVSSGDRWQAAEEDCERDGAHLVVVNDAAENAALPFGRWIGYSETVSEGTFLWVTGAGASAFAPPWGGTDPDTSADAYCVEHRTDGWHDDNCWELKPYVCEHDGRPADRGTWDDSGRF